MSLRRARVRAWRAVDEAGSKTEWALVTSNLRGGRNGREAQSYYHPYRCWQSYRRGLSSDRPIAHGGIRKRRGTVFRRRVGKPPKGIFFTVRPETTKPWRDRAFYFLLEMEGRDPFIVAPDIANQKKEEDVIRPVLIVRYVTMAGEEGLWPLKLDPPDGKSNRWNTSALNILEVAASGKWVRLVSAKGHYRHQVSKKTFEQVPPKFTDRLFPELINISFKDQIITTLNHEIWDVLENGSNK
jgi:hypothetical protein